ncbi:uncharacterized protein C8Q71DRAFT_861353 [Rhodofomes roseus]|uniref:Hint domain-containing protein n=1 Tax=Rhodofomes roseus TaxID=34475 RepID=A0ABQ8K545_9APHY|nr:uncharacterized protein C8Q71DRAFT_861353 [Rhodofomes roseus]KAH9832065.1 hypothetical protein C8Q71DRAFT_861353 [Rhodofomes roseus]
MFLTFSANKKAPDVSTLRGTAPLEDLLRTRAPKPPSYAVSVEVYVRREPEVNVDLHTETWVVDRQPERPLARGHVLTLRSLDHVIGSGRISTITCLARHWVTFRLAGAREGTQIRVPVPWAGLSGYKIHIHATQFHMLSPTPEPHEIFKDTPPFADPDVNPYEFDLTAGKEICLLAKLRSELEDMNYDGQDGED